MEKSADQHDFRITVAGHIAVENALGPRLPPAVNVRQRRKSRLRRLHFNAKWAIRGNNDQRVRPQIDRRIITDEDPAHPGDFVVNAGRVDASHLEPKARADEALREGNEPYVQSAQERVQIAR